MLRPELISLIQDAVDELALDIAGMCATDAEYNEALEFAVADLQMAFGPWSAVDDDDFVDDFDDIQAFMTIDNGFIPLDYDDDEELNASE